MKKLIFCLIAVGFTASAWGQSIGIGGHFSPIFFGTSFENKTTFMEKTIQAMSESYMDNHIGWGGFVFFDINYLEASIGVRSDSTRWEMRVNSPIIEPGETMYLDYTALSIGLMGEYTFFRDSKRARFFLQLGCEYDIVLSAKFNHRRVDNPLDWSHLWINSGVGFDLLTRSPWFIRLENSFTREYGTIQRFSRDMYPGFAIIFRAAVGYRF